MKKPTALTWVLVLFLTCIKTFSQTYTVGVPVNRLIGTYHEYGAPFCYPAPAQNATFPVSTVTGVDYVIIVDSVSISNSIYVTPGNKIINQGDSLFITSAVHAYSFYYPSGGTVWSKIYAIGTPQVAGQPYPCGTLAVTDPLLQCNDNLNYGFTNCQDTVMATIESFTSLQKLKVYPNPSYNDVLIHLDNNIENCEIIFYNNLGEKVCQQKITQSNNDINIFFLPKGLYHLILFQNKKPLGSCLFAKE